MGLLQEIKGGSGDGSRDKFPEPRGWANKWSPLPDGNGRSSGGKVAGDLGSKVEAGALQPQPAEAQT